MRHCSAIEWRILHLKFQLHNSDSPLLAPNQAFWIRRCVPLEFQPDLRHCKRDASLRKGRKEGSGGNGIGSTDPDEGGCGGISRLSGQLVDQDVCLCALSGHQTSHAVATGRQSAVWSRHDAQVARTVTDVCESLGRTAAQQHAQPRQSEGTHRVHTRRKSRKNFGKLHKHQRAAFRKVTNS